MASLPNRQALLGMLQYYFDLLARDPREPFKKIIDPRAAFEVFEQCPHRYPRVREQPFAAAFIRRAFYCGALAPIEHTLILFVAQVACKSRAPFYSITSPRWHAASAARKIGRFGGVRTSNPRQPVSGMGAGCARRESDTRRQQIAPPRRRAKERHTCRPLRVRTARLGRAIMPR